MRKLCAAGSMLLASPCLAATTQVAAPAIPWDAEVIVRCGDYVGTAEHIGNGRYITANHVIEKDPQCTIRGEKARIVHADPVMDIAELSGPPMLAKFEIDCGGLKPGRQYLATGYAGGMQFMIFPLIASNFGRHPDGGNIMLIGNDVIPGMSGGALIGEDSRMPGMVLQRFGSRARPLSDTYLCGGKLNA